MKNILEKLKNRKKYVIAGAVVLLALLYFIFGRGGNGDEVYAVARQDVTQSVVLSGEVETSNKADLGFAASGRIQSIFVKNNEVVGQGARLAQLEIGDLAAELKIRQANLRAATVDLEAAKEELRQVAEQEDAKVESAYRTLLTEGLELVPHSSTYTAKTPTLSGSYGGKEGRYKIIFNRPSVTSSDVEILTFELEKTKRLVNKESSTPLGTRGLYITLPDEIVSYQDTIWYVNIPNKASSEYLANYNAYNEAKKNRDVAIQKAEAEYKRLATEGDNGSATVAEAEVEKINAEIRKNVIYAPFSGKVTNIEKEIGENVSVGERVISILGEERLEVVLQVSELDVSRLVPGATVTLTLDALPGEMFDGTLKTINSRDTEIEGVPIYEAFVEVASDPRIKTGMSVNGTIVIASKTAVLAVPSYFVKKVGEKNIVTVLTENGKSMEREVTLGITGTDSMVEVIAGLSEGEKVITPKN